MRLFRGKTYIPEVTSVKKIKLNEDEIENYRGRFPEGSYLRITIRQYNGDPGFFIYVHQAIRQGIWAIKNGLTPFVYIHRTEGSGYYYDPRYGENLWEYYFEPLNSLNYNDLPANRVFEFHERGIWTLHWGTIQTFPHREGNESCPKARQNIYLQDLPYQHPDVQAWYLANRTKAHRFIESYIRPKKHITDKVDRIFKQHFKSHNVLGVHVRGTDKAFAKVIPLEDHFCYIDDYLAKHPGSKVFCATDARRTIDVMKQRYGDKLIYIEALRSSEEQEKARVSPFGIDTANHNYNKGEEVLIDCLLLSRCNYLIKSASKVSEFAIYFNLQLHANSIDLNHELGFGAAEPAIAAMQK